MAHFSVASLFQIGLSLVFICWTKESTGAAFSLEEEFKQLKENYIQMKEIVKNLEAKDFQMQNKVNELEFKDVQMRDKVTNLEAKVAQQDSLLSDLLREKNERTAAANHFESAPIGNYQSALSVNGLPSSCSDLKMIGHTLNGFYSIVGSAMMESVFCDFSKLPSDADFQKWIGYTDVKSASVHFYVQRNSNFDTIGTPIPFALEVVNNGNAMNLTSGIFTASVTGTYFFSFTGLAEFPASTSTIGLGIGLRLNGDLIGFGWVEEANTVAGQNSPLTVQSTLNLKKDDQVWLSINDMSSGVNLYDNSGQYSHFTGFMLEEQIVESL